MEDSNILRTIIRTVWGIILTLFLISPCLKSDQLTSVPSVGIVIAASSKQPFGRIADEAGVGYGGMAGIYFHPAAKSAPEIALRLVAEYDIFPGNNSDLSDFKFIRSGLDLQFVVDYNRQRDYYLLIGAGFSKIEIDKTGAVDKFSDNSFYFSSGVGGAYLIKDRWAIIVELIFTDISGKGVRDFQFLQLRLGVRF